MESVNKAVSTGKYEVGGEKYVLNKKIVKKSMESSKMIPVAVDVHQLIQPTKKSADLPVVEVLKGDTLDGLCHLLSTGNGPTTSLSSSEPAVLVFASDTNPGGSKTSTNQGTQEEAMCRMSTLRLAQVTLDYPIPRDGIAYVPHVQALVVAPSGYSAPCFTALCGALRDCVAGSEPTHQETHFLQSKIFGILDQAVLHGHAELVLGAWGCGAFGNPVEWVAATLRHCLQLDKYRGHLHRVVFAIPHAKTLRVFQQCFADY